MKNFLIELVIPLIFVILFLYIKKGLVESFDAYLGGLIIGMIVNLREKVDKLDKNS